MSPALPTLRSELPGWILRGTLCALSSVYWAVVTGFQHPVEIMGMVAGIAGWALVYAWLSFRVLPARRSGLRVVRALKRAVWIKFGLTAAGWLLFAGINVLKLQGIAPFSVLGLADMWLGLVALKLVALIGGFHGGVQIDSLDSFGWTALTTLVDGALFAIIIGVITALVLGWWGVRESPDHELSPVRPAD